MPGSKKPAMAFRFDDKTIRRIERASKEYEMNKTATIRQVFKEWAEARGLK